MKRTPILFAFLLLATAISGVSQPLSAQPREEKLVNGMRLLMWPDPQAQDVTVRVRIHSGAAFDPQGKEGLMWLLAQNIFPNEAAREYFRDDLGGGLDVATTYDYIQITTSAKPENLLSMLTALGGSITAVPIDKETTPALKTVRLAELAKADDAAAVDRARADLAAASRLLGTFPYGRPVGGTAETVSKIDAADLLDARNRLFTADNATVTITGNFNAKTAFAGIRRYFGPWTKSDKLVPSTFRQPDPPKSELLVVTEPKASTTQIRFAVRGTSRNSKDMPASQVFARILETRLKNRIPSALAGNVFVRNEPHVLPGVITIGFTASRNDVGSGNGKIEVIDLLMKAMGDPITDGEFQTAKSAFVAEREKIDAATLWLDSVTYAFANPAAEITAVRGVSLADVKTYADGMAKAPAASVLILPNAK